MKNFLILSFTLLFCSLLHAQNASEGSVDFIKGQANGVSITLEGQVKNVEDVMEKKFKGLKGGKNEKGFKSFTAQIYPAISSDMLDYYYKVEKAGDNKVKISFVISKGYDNFLTSSQNSGPISNTKKMLEELVAEVRRYELQIAVDAQTKVYEKVVKTQESIIKDGQDLVKEQAKLEEDLKQNKTDQETNKKNQEEQKKIMELEKKTLDELSKKLGVK